jgi:hypothetical protein
MTQKPEPEAHANIIPRLWKNIVGEDVTFNGPGNSRGCQKKKLHWEEIIWWTWRVRIQPQTRCKEAMVVR